MIETDIRNYLTALESKPKLVLVTCVFETYWELINKTSCKLSAKRQTEAFSAGNICIVDHVIEIMQKRVEQWKKVQADFNIPWEVNEDLKDYSPQAKQKIEALLKDLVWNLRHFAEKLKMEDIAQKELELAQMIGSLLQKDEYFKNAYVQLAIWCLERLRVRELYDIFPLETLCHQLHQEVDQTKRQSIFQQVYQGIKDDFMDDSGLELCDKLRILALLALSSDGLKSECLDDLLETGEIPLEER